MNSLLFLILFSVNFVFSSERYYSQIIHPIPYEEKSMTVTVGPFSRIFGSIGKIHLDPTRPSDSILIEGYENIIEELAVSTYNNTLYIGAKNPLNQIISSNNSLTISVGIKSYLKLILAGTSFYVFSSKHQVDELDLELIGQAECKVLCEVKKLDVRMSGSSTLSCEGKADVYTVLMYDRALMDITRLEGRLTHSVQTGSARFTTLYSTI